MERRTFLKTIAAGVGASIVGATAVYLALWVFVSGGIIDR